MIWLWWAAERTGQAVLGWSLGDRDMRAAQALGAQVPRSDKALYATDQFPCYNSLFSDVQHIRGKAHTFTIESMNNRLRCYLARLNRRTHCYSKSANNLRDSLLFIFQRKLGCKLTEQTGSASSALDFGKMMLQYRFSNPRFGA